MGYYEIERGHDKEFDDGAVLYLVRSVHDISPFSIEKLVKFYEALPEKEKKVIGLYFGLEDGNVRTWTDITHETGVTYEEAKKIKDGVLTGMRMMLGLEKKLER